MKWKGKGERLLVTNFGRDERKTSPMVVRLAPSRGARCAHSQLFFFFFHASGLDSWAIPRLAVVDWVKLCCTELFPAFSLDCFYGSIVCRTERLGNTLFRAVLYLIAWAGKIANSLGSWLEFQNTPGDAGCSLMFCVSWVRRAQSSTMNQQFKRWVHRPLSSVGYAVSGSLSHFQNISKRPYPRKQWVVFRGTATDASWSWIAILLDWVVGSTWGTIRQTVLIMWHQTVSLISYIFYTIFFVPFIRKSTTLAWYLCYHDTCTQSNSNTIALIQNLSLCACDSCHQCVEYEKYYCIPMW